MIENTVIRLFLIIECENGSSNQLLISDLILIILLVAATDIATKTFLKMLTKNMHRVAQ